MHLRPLYKILAIASVFGLIAGVALLSHSQALTAFKRNMDELAVIEGISPDTVDPVRTIDGLHLQGSDTREGFGALLASRKPPAYDKNGILMVVYRPEFVGQGQAGPQYNPYSISNAVLEYVRYRNDPRAISEIRRYLDFLLAYGTKLDTGELLLPYNFDYPSTKGKAPWYSAMDQAISASAFLWGHRLTGDARYLDAALALVFALQSDTKPPFLINRPVGVWPKEYPTWEYTVLDGALSALIGVWDMSRALPADHPSRPRVAKLLADMKAGVLDALPCFESAAFGHFYADGGYSLGAGYQRTNIRLLKYLSALDPAFGEYAETFSIKSRSVVVRAWHAAEITVRDFLANRRLIEKFRPPCVATSPRHS